MRKPLSIIAYLIVSILIMGVVAHAVTSNPPSTAKSSAKQVTKWDAGEKDLLASMETENQNSETKESSPIVTFLSFIFKLAVVVALAYGTICALKKFTGLKNTIGGGNRHRIKVVENTTLGANRSLHLVEIGSKRLLVASTASQISLLTELTTDDLPATPDASETQTVSQHQPASFKDQLSTFLGAKPDTGDAAQNVAQMIRGSSSFLQEKIIELGRLRRTLKDV